jgi:toxin ParE1/3/4
MSVEFSPVAERDLEEIGDYIAHDNSHRALTFILEIRERCQKIEKTPNAAPLREDILSGVRVLKHNNYLIFYSILKSKIRIERILHGARDIEALLL